MSEYAIEMLNITKEFPGIIANDNITLRVKKNTIHALLGENGAGKSTLMSILFGLYKPNKGIIKIRDKEVKITSPNIANDLGIGMVHQHFKLVDNFTVTENIILGCEPKKALNMIDFKKAKEKVVQLSKLYGLDVDPDALIENINVGMQQRVEILKMLYRDNDILIFDEPTAVLTPQEIEELMKVMKNLIKEGKTILLITHKLKEIKKVADECTILRKGKYIDTVDVRNVDEAKMASLMVGRDVNFNTEKKDANPKDVILEIKDLVVKNHKGIAAVNKFNLKVRQGEIMAIAGIDGNGQSELVYALCGMVPIESGEIILNGENITKIGIKERYEKGISHIPEDRHKHGLILDFSLKENFVIHNYNKKEFSNRGIINKKAVDNYANRLIDEFDVRSGTGKESKTRDMSGGNQQKAIIARELDNCKDLLLVVQPTRGLDVGAIENIHSRIIKERDKGKAVLLVSLELDEVLNLADNIAVIHNGELQGLVKRSSTDENELGLMMSGSSHRYEEVYHEEKE